MADQYFVNRNGKIFGPFTKEAVKLAASTNKLTTDDLISTSKTGPWRKLKADTEDATSTSHAASDDDGDVLDDSFEDESFGSGSKRRSYDDLPPLPVPPLRESRKKRPETDPDDDNPYASFKSKKASRENIDLGAARIASPWQRLRAVIVDGLAVFVFLFPGVIPALIAFQIPDVAQREASPLLPTAALVFLLGAIALIGCQLYLQVNRAQSIGKWYCNLQIFDVETMQPASFFKNWILRSFVNNLISGIPMVGGIYAIVDICFIFSDNHRCLHDLLAGTQVLDISQQV